MNRLDKLKKEIVNMHKDIEGIKKMDSLTAMHYGCYYGFDGALDECKKIIEELEKALNKIAIKQKFYDDKKDYFLEVVRFNLIAKEALQKLKQFKDAK